MPGMSGFDVLNQLQPIDFQVIFVTSYDRYAIKAIRFSAVDYLLKPLDIDDLMQAVARAGERISNHKANHDVQSVLHNVAQAPTAIEQVAVPTLEGIDFIKTEHIIYCAAEGGYTNVYLKNGDSKLISRTLKEFDTLLSDSGFCRVHHNSLINLKHIQKYIKGEGGYVILTNEHHVDISRRKKEEFLALLNKL
jgi:two-component system LytT family response regulator